MHIPSLVIDLAMMLLAAGIVSVISAKYTFRSSWAISPWVF